MSPIFREADLQSFEPLDGMLAIPEPFTAMSSLQMPLRSALFRLLQYAVADRYRKAYVVVIMTPLI
jgi:hypothetical protein